MAQPVLLAPLNAVRTAVYDRLNTDANTSGYTLAKEGGSAAFPYLVVGPAYKGSGGTDPDLGVVVLVQVDAFASTSGGGAFRVSAMMDAVALALTADDLTVEVRTADGPTVTSRPLTITIEDDVLNPDLRDAADGETYAQRFVRFRFLLTT